ncbi:MAG: hypothetical protein WBL55_22810, partial [Xanthobacteraceae bacterium]
MLFTAHPRPLRHGRPAAYAEIVNLVGIAGAATANRRAEQRKRMQSIRMIDGMLYHDRAAVFGADQVTFGDIQGVEETAEIGGQLVHPATGNPAVRPTRRSPAYPGEPRDTCQRDAARSRSRRAR